jgi:hypothetical protein
VRVKFIRLADNRTCAQATSHNDRGRWVLARTGSPHA